MPEWRKLSLENCSMEPTAPRALGTALQTPLLASALHRGLQKPGLVSERE